MSDIHFFLLLVFCFINSPTELESPRWGAPETLDYPPKWTTAADIYSLGLVFYEIVAREVPYKSETNFVTL